MRRLTTTVYTKSDYMKKLLIFVLCVTFNPFTWATGNPALFQGLLIDVPNKSRLMIVVELARGTMSFLEASNGKIDVIEQVPVSIGKNGYGKLIEGDKRTPVGIYEIDRFIPDAELPERYGPGAFTLDYPNLVDKRRERTGSGIWIHGIDRNLKARPFLDSDGCVVIDNKQFDRLKPILDKRPLVILADKIPESNPTLEAEFRAAFGEWELAWESLDVEDYLSYYSSSFDNGDSDYNAWSAHKRRVGELKTRIDVTLNNVSILRYPGEDNVVKVDFNQRYVSNNYSGYNEKTQYWQRQENGQWQIIYEASR